MNHLLEFKIWDEMREEPRALTFPAEWVTPAGYLVWDEMVDGRLYVLRVDGNHARLERYQDAEDAE